MRKVGASELPKYIGKNVRVVYSVREPDGPNKEVFVYGADITGEVILKKFDPKNQTVTIERPNGKIETMNPMLVLSEEEALSN